jgi:polyphosphate glucokinase
MAAHRFGIDIGGTGIKGAVVDIETGALVTDRVRVLTPQPATPDAVMPLAAGLVTDAGYDGAVGCAFPAVIKHGVARTAANVDQSWIGTSVVDALGCHLDGRAVTAVNDADAAGLAEVRFGAGKDSSGVVVMLTVGTGIGSALFLDGALVPNTELGHLQVGGHDAETRASEAAREADDLSWKKWAKRFSEYLETLEALVWPDLFVVGGGISKKPDHFLPLLTCRTTVVTATLANTAGIIGAALSAE